MSSVASFVAECLAPFPYFFYRLFGLVIVIGFSQASAQMPPRGIYTSDVTLPCLSPISVLYCCGKVEKNSVTVYGKGSLLTNEVLIWIKECRPGVVNCCFFSSFP
jgi:hypothetical protein